MSKSVLAQLKTVVGSIHYDGVIQDTLLIKQFNKPINMTVDAEQRLQASSMDIVNETFEI
jgi:hypothetical protein